MIFITQLIYINEGENETFLQFEKSVLPIISRYKGRLLLRMRPTEESFVETQIEKPFEIHLVAFDNEQDFEDFKNDAERKNFLHLKERSVKSVLLIKGSEIK